MSILRKSRILCVALIIAIIATIIAPIGSFTASAATQYTDGYYTYTVSDGKVTITDVDTVISGDVIIPSTLGGYPVTSIGNSAFSSCSSLISIVIPDSVTNIGAYVFQDCTSLKSIRLPNSLKIINWKAFLNCSSLTSIVIPDSVVTIDEGAFNYCSSLEDVVFGKSVTSIGRISFAGCAIKNLTLGNKLSFIDDFAFSGCDSLESVEIPNNVNTIGMGAFSGCDALRSITFLNDNISLGSGMFDRCSEDLTIYATFKSSSHKYAKNNSLKFCATNGINDGDYLYTVSSGEATITDYYGAGGDITIPETLGGYSVTAIGDMAFSSAYLLNVDTSGVKTIGEKAFADCDCLITISMPNVTYIDERAFYLCTSLSSVYIPEVNVIGDFAFGQCGYFTIYAPSYSYACQYALSNNIKFVSTSKIKDVSYEIYKDNLTFIITTSSGEYSKVKFAFADTPNDIEGIVSNYTVNSCGDYVWQISTSLPDTSTRYVFDLYDMNQGVYIQEYFYSTVEIVPTFQSVDYEINGDKIIFTVITTAGDYNRIKVANASAVGTSLGVGTYTVDANGNYVWTVKADAPTETTTYAFDLRTTSNKYLKDYYMVEVEYVDTEICKSVSYAIEGDKIVFTVVTLAGDFNRIKVTTADNLGGSLGVGTYTVDKNGNYVWTVKANAPKETATFAFDLRTTTNKYLKDYYEFMVEVTETVEIFKSTSYEIVDGKVVFTVVTPAGDYNRVKISLLDNITSYVKYVDTYTVNADGDYVWTLKFNAPTAVTEYALDIRVASTMKYVKDYYYVTIDQIVEEPEPTTVYVSANGEIKDGKITFTVVTKPTDINRVKVMLTSNQTTYVKLIDKYTVDANGNYVWTATVAAPSETTSYTLDVRSSETGRYMKAYFTFKVAVEEKAEIYKSVSYDIIDGKIVFTVVTTAGNYDRIKLANSATPKTSIAVGSYTVNAYGDYVWTVKTTAPIEFTSYAFDLRNATTSKYLKDYFNYDVAI